MTAELDRLVARLRANLEREESARRLDALLRPRLAGYFRAQGFAADAVDDLVQKTLTRVFLHVGGLRAEASFLPWLFVIARNVGRSERGRQARERAVWQQPEDGEIEAEAEVIASDEPEAATRQAARERLAAVAGALPALPTQQRRCLLLAARDGLAYEEIAELLAISPLTVRNHLAEARRRLRALVAAREGAPARGAT